MNHSIKIIALLFIVCTTILLGIFIFKNSNNTKWSKKYALISKLNEQNGYQINRVTNGHVISLFNSFFYSKEKLENLDEYDYLEWSKSSKLFLDTIHPSIWIYSSKQPFIESENFIDEWYNLSITGEIISKFPFTDSIQTQHWIPLKSELSDPYYLIESPSDLYVFQFAKEEFNTNSLNPFRGWGNTTGKTSTFTWSGTAYLKLKLDTSTIAFKANTAWYKNFGYRFDVDLYRIPKQYTNGKEIVIFYQGDQFKNKEDLGLYFITPIK